MVTTPHPPAAVDQKTASDAGEYLRALLERGDDPIRALEATRHVFGFGEDHPPQGFDLVKRAAQLELDKLAAADAGGTATPADPDGVQHELDDLTAWAHEVCEAAGVDVAEEGWDEKAVEAIRAARTPERPRAASGHIVPGDWRYYRLAEIAHAALFYEDDEDGPIFRWSDRRLASDDDGLLKCAADATAGAVWNNRAEIIALLAAPTPGEPSPSVAAPPLRGDSPQQDVTACCDELNPDTGYRCRRTPIHDAGKSIRKHVQIDKLGQVDWWITPARALLAGGEQ